MDPVLKQRLIGAGVIWLLAMIFLPLILGGERESQNTRVELGLPAEVGAPREVREVRLDAPESGALPDSRAAESEAAREAGQPHAQVPEPPAEDTAEPVASESRSEAVSDVAESAPEPQPVPEPQPAPEPQPTTATDASSGDWFVQVGSFGNPENALGLQERLEDHDYPAMISKYEADGTTLHRVRVGGFETREAAEETQAALYERMGLNGRVLEAD